MAIYRETAGNITLPVVILQNVVAYPSSNIAFDIQDKLSREAVGGDESRQIGSSAPGRLTFRIQ